MLMLDSCFTCAISAYNLVTLLVPMCSRHLLVRQWHQTLCSIPLFNDLRCLRLIKKWSHLPRLIMNTNLIVLLASMILVLMWLKILNFRKWNWNGKYWERLKVDLMELTQILHMFAGSLKLLELNFCNQTQLEGLEIIKFKINAFVVINQWIPFEIG